MTRRALSLTALTVYCALLAACTSPQPQADLSPPAMNQRDAKAELESGRRPTLRRQ